MQTDNQQCLTYHFYSSILQLIITMSFFNKINDVAIVDTFKQVFQRRPSMPASSGKYSINYDLFQQFLYFCSLLTVLQPITAMQFPLTITITEKPKGTTKNFVQTTKTYVFHYCTSYTNFLCQCVDITKHSNQALEMKHSPSSDLTFSYTLLRKQGRRRQKSCPILTAQH